MANADTRNKRAACVNFSLPFGRVYPNPDGNLTTAADREHIALSYPLGTVTTITFSPIWASSANQLIGPEGGA